jgi:hypothetical protein
MEFAKLVLLCFACISGMGAVLGGFSALFCPEAFTLGRPPVFGSLPAPVLGLLWGWLEFMLPAITVGLAVAMAANVGPRPAVKALFFRKPLWAHLALIAVIAVVTAIAGYVAIQQGAWHVVGPLATLPAERHRWIGAVWWGSRGAHVGNLAGGIGLAIWTWRKREEFEEMVKSGRGGKSGEES